MIKNHFSIEDVYINFNVIFLNIFVNVTWWINNEDTWKVNSACKEMYPVIGDHE